MIGELAAQGKAILVVSSYLPELFGICDRIAVMSRGALCEARATSEWTEHEVMEVATRTESLDREPGRIALRRPPIVRQQFFAHEQGDRRGRQARAETATQLRDFALRGTLGWVWTVFGPFLGLVLITLLFAALTRESGRFITLDNWRTIAVQSVIVATAALGMTIIMIAGGIDLSVGSTVAW